MPLSDLRLSENFRTTVTGQMGVVLDWGHIRTPRNYGPPRRRIPVVVTEVAGKCKLLRPELVVVVDGDRPHWSADRKPEPSERWRPYVGEAEDGEDEEA